RERRQNAADDAEQNEEDSSAGRRPRLFLMAVRQLVLDDLPGAHLLEGADHQRVEDERDRERDHERGDIEYGARRGLQIQSAVSSLTSSSRRTPCEALM